MALTPEGTSAARPHGKPPASKRVIERMAEAPVVRADQKASWPMPAPQTTPRPVIEIEGEIILWVVYGGGRPGWDHRATYTRATHADVHTMPLWKLPYDLSTAQSASAFWALRNATSR